MAQTVEMPPPLAPVWTPSFHTLSDGRGPSESIRVPPTPVTYGWLAGSSTCAVGGAGKQSSAPSSPEAEKIDMPSAAASWKSVFSAEAALDWLTYSHCPHEAVTTC